MASADLVIRRFGAGIVLGEISVDAACRSAIEWKTPRRMRCRVILEKKFSTD